MAGDWLLISDLDQTLLGHEEALKRFANWHRNLNRRLLVAYATGRFFADVDDLVQATVLPRPVAVIGGVGTEIQLYPSGESLSSWAKSEAREFNAHEVRGSLAEWPDLTLQPEPNQSLRKVSFFKRGADPRELHAIRKHLKGTAGPTDVIYSSRRDLDVVPAGINKGTAARHLARHLGIRWDRVLVSGDSGNDLAMFHQGFKGITVNNAHEELKALQLPNVFHATQSYADGVRQGIGHWMQQTETP
jgi:sucrose-6F-phosphate phosphohydrolase